MRNNYKTCVIKMEQFEEFVHHGHTMTGLQGKSSTRLIKYYEIDYSIYSYTTLICFVNFKDKTYCINPQRFSVTTSKQVGYIRKAAKVWERKGFERILWL